MQPLLPIYTLHLFAPMRAELLRVLNDLTPEQWALPTACAGWSVKDVALHIWADDMSVLSGQRDGFGWGVNFSSWDELVQWINARNDLWVKAARRLSSRMLCSQLEFTGQQLVAYFSSLDMDASSSTIVDWAGSDFAPVWLEVAREYSEFWMHHQHVCEGLGLTSLKTPEYVTPLVDIFLRALPHTYRHTSAEEGSHLQIQIYGETEALWNLVYQGGKWGLYTQVELPPTATIRLEADTTWRLLTKGLPPDIARQRSEITGAANLADPFFNMVSIIA